MNRKLIIEELKKTLLKIKETPNAKLTLSERLKFSKQNQALESSRPLAQILEKQDEFLKSKNLHFNHGSGSLQFSPGAVALFLCRQAEQKGPEAAVDSLIDIFAKTEADLLCVMALRGVNCEKEIQLTKTIKMVPMALLPPSWRKDSIENFDTAPLGEFWKISAFNPLGIGPSNLERAFLITSIKVQPVIFDFETLDLEKSPELENNAFTSLHGVRLCLTSLGNCSPLSEYCWKQYKDAVLEDAANLSSGMSYSLIEIAPLSLRKSGSIQEEKAAPIIESYFKLPNKFQSQIKRALERLNQAMRRSTVGDIAVELSIALESLLLDTEIGDNRFKVSLRSGIAFSNDLEERIQCREVIKEMYDLRSKLVHNGDDSNSVPGKREIIEKAITFTSLIINNLIKNEKKPEWSRLELSGKSIEET